MHSPGVHTGGVSIVDEVLERLAGMPPAERALAAQELLTTGRARLAEVRRAAIAEEVAARGRGGVSTLAAELGVHRNRVHDAIRELGL